MSSFEIKPYPEVWQALDSDQEMQINSMCTIFAESEVVSMKNRGIPRQHIARSVQPQWRIVWWQLARLGYGEMVVPQHPDITGALGVVQHGAKEEVSGI